MREAKWKSSELSNCEFANSLLNLPIIRVPPVFSAIDYFFFTQQQ